MAKQSRFTLFAAVIFVLTACSSVAQAQPTTWCLRWNDGCSTCSRFSLDGEITCTPAKVGCTTRHVRCERADRDELKRRCETSRVMTSCNVCSGPIDRQVCTLRGCGPGEMWVVCLRLRRNAS